MANILVTNARLAFPNLFKPTAFEASQDAKFNGTFILPANDPQLEKLRAVIKQVTLDKWGGKVPPGLKVFLRSGDEKSHLAGFGEDTVFFSASSLQRPGLYDKRGNPVVESDGLLYAGCYVNVRIDVWAQDNQYGKRINAGLSGVQFFKDGEPFGGGRPAQANEFPVYEEDENDDFFGNAA